MALKPKQTSAIERAVDALFQRAEARFLGTGLIDKKLAFSADPALTLPSLYAAAGLAEGNIPDGLLLAPIVRVAKRYLQAERARAKARVVGAVDAFLAEADASGRRADAAKVLGGQLADVWRDVGTAVRRIAATEGNRAKNVGILDAVSKINAVRGIEDPVVFFVCVRDEHLCAECRRLHLLPDGRPRLWLMSELSQGHHQRGEERPSIGGEHPNCFIPDTEVQGSFVAGLKAWYSGKVIQLATSSGRRLTVTPNHPILTAGGLRAAKDLREGDDLVAYLGDVGRPLAMHQVNENHAPSRIEDVFGALRQATLSSQRAASAGDLHGDARFVQGEIEVVRPEGFLWRDRDPAGAERSRYFSFEQPHVGLGSGLGDGLFCLLCGGASFPPHSSPGFRTLSFDGGGIKAQDLPFEPLRFGPAADLDASLLEASDEGGTRDAHFLGEIFHGDLACNVAFDQILSVHEVDYSGWVYDLQSPQGWVVANELFASNCRCTLATLLPSYGFNAAGMVTYRGPGHDEFRAQRG